MQCASAGPFVAACVSLASVAFSGEALAQGCAPPVVNMIVCENLLIGSDKSAWQIDTDQTNNISDVDENLEGFADRMSYDPGQTVNFKVSTTASAYHIEIYRLGYYRGAGARLVETLSSPVAMVQQACVHGTDNLIDCSNWLVSASWVIPAGSVSGVYIAKLVRHEAGVNKANHVVFVVRRNIKASKLIVQVSDTTWQAYNWWGNPNGVQPRQRYSLYFGPGGLAGGIGARAHKVSYNRPFAHAAQYPFEMMGNNVFLVEHSMIRWLERNGFDVSYISGSDTDGAFSFSHNRVFLSIGHDEYWSGGQRAKIEAARDAGLHLAFFSGNEVYWKVRWENSHRTLVCYKEPSGSDPLLTEWTGQWRDATNADAYKDLTVIPENRLIGTAWMVIDQLSAKRLRVSGAEGKLRFWRDTGLATLADATVATLKMPLGYEWDEDWDNGKRPPGLIRLSTSNHFLPTGYILDTPSLVGVAAGAGVPTHHLTLYRTSAGSLVFGAGSFGIILGLDNDNDHTRLICAGTCPCTQTPTGPDCTDPVFQQAVVNLFADMGVQPDTLMGGLVPADPSADQTGPTVTITNPVTTARKDTTVTFEGTASDLGGRVAGVEVSVDGGASWRAATRRTGTGDPWRYNWTPTTVSGPPVVIRTRAIDDSGNIGSFVTQTVTVLTSQPTIVVHAAGTPAGTPAPDSFPTMELLFNGQVVRTFRDVQGNVAKREFHPFGYSQAAALPPLKNIRVRFANDGVSPLGEDRNLYLEKLTINGVSRAPRTDTVGFYMSSCSPPPPQGCGAFRLKHTHFWSGHDRVVPFGIAGDLPISGDWLGTQDEDTIGVFRNGTFFLSDSYDSASYVFQIHSTPGIPVVGVPVSGNWDGLGGDGVGVFSNGVFYLKNDLFTGPPDAVIYYGFASDVPIAGDWNGNGTDSIGVFRGGWWFLKNDGGDPDQVVAFGGFEIDKPLVGDWDWSGSDSIGVFRWSSNPEDPTVFLRTGPLTGPGPTTTFRAGASDDSVLAGHWKRP